VERAVGVTEESLLPDLQVVQMDLPIAAAAEVGEVIHIQAALVLEVQV
jgi:hypothetical protein